MLFSACESGSGEDTSELKVDAVSVATPIVLDQPEFATKAPPTIEIIQVTPTPLPTATPTPTATPVVYEIQQGDTLLGIAIQNFTTVEDIQALNPDIRPELLSVGQEIVLPPAATPVFAGEPPTQVPISISVLNHALYPDGSGGLWVVGEIRNNSGFLVGDVMLDAKIFGDGGIEVGRIEILPAKREMGIGEISPFGGLLPQKPDGVLQAEIFPAGGIQLNGQDAASAEAFGSADLEFVQSDKLAQVTGSVPLPAGVDLSAYRLLVIAYDHNDQVTGFSTHPIDQFEMNGNELIIEVSVFLIGGDAARIHGEILRR